jgi:DNA-binding GntR family transcriptional regulator
MQQDPTETAEKASHAAFAYEEVLRRLRNGEIGKVDRIVDKALATELDMSRMPAREALLRLVNEGYLVGTTRGFMLPQLSVADIMEIFEIRSLLEPRAAAAAAAVLDQDVLARMEAAYRDLLVASHSCDPVGMNHAHAEFRAIWLGAVPNRRMAATISRYFDQVYAIRGATLHDPEVRRTSMTLLAAVYNAFLARDTLAVMDAMASFIEASRLSFAAQQQAYADLIERARP